MCQLGERIEALKISKHKPITAWRWFLVNEHESVLRPVYVNRHHGLTAYNAWRYSEATASKKPTVDNNFVGLFCYTSPKHAQQDKPSFPQRRQAILGQIEIWGKIQRHYNGYRAEHARITVLYPSKVGQATKLRKNPNYDSVRIPQPRKSKKKTKLPAPKK